MSSPVTQALCGKLTLNENRDSLDWLFREDWGKEGNQKSYIGSREGEGDLFSSAHERQPAVIYKDPCSSHAQTIILVGCYLG